MHKVHFFHSSTQHSLAPHLQRLIAGCTSLEIVSGYLTPAGLDALDIFKPRISAKISRFVIGAGTRKGFDALDRLIDEGATSESIRVHLGWSDQSGSNQNIFRPMMHSKIYLFTHGAQKTAFVGSHNCTQFALEGLNGEAGVLIEGAADDPVMRAIESHVKEAFEQAEVYDRARKNAYALWATQNEKAVVKEIGAEGDKSAEPTIVICCKRDGRELPSSGETIYIEIDTTVSITSLGRKIDLYLFDMLPSNPQDALSQTQNAQYAYKCEIELLDVSKSVVELVVDWTVGDPRNPVLKRVTGNLRPRTRGETQQVRVRIGQKLDQRYRYDFNPMKHEITPIFGDDDVVVDQKQNRRFRLVRRLEERQKLRKVQFVPDELKSESGSFIVYAPDRIPMSEFEQD